MPFDILIVGGGIAGLTTAITLRAHGHHVTVLEKQPTLHRSAGASIALQPGAVRVLRAYGLSDTFTKDLHQPKATWNWRRFESGEVLSKREVDQYARTFGTESWTFTRQRLQAILVQEALKADINVTVGCKVSDIDEEKPSVMLEDGSELRADIIIGADGTSNADAACFSLGIGSTTRKCILPQTQGKAISKLSAWMVHIPIPILQQDPELQPCLKDVNFWLGPSRSITAATVPDQDAYNMTLFVDHANQDAYIQDEGGSFEQIKELFHDFEPTITKLLSHAPTQEGYLWRISELPPLPRWISNSGRVILLGDAAHAMVPFAAQGASQCVEDAGALAECLSRDGADLMDLLRVFEMIRKPRAESVAARSAARQLMFHLSDGPKQQERDEKMRLQVRSYEPDKNVWKGEHIDEPPDINSPLHDPYLMGHDVIQYAKRVLDRELGCAEA